jgi:ubiquinone/menaquinone biosynthesis C-methylase UbiE
VTEQSSSLPREIEAHYLETRESERLSGTHGELERLRTLEVLARVLPPAPAVLLDVGSAAGAYALPRSERGYVVHLMDPIEVRLEQAKARSKSSGITLGSITKGDARRLTAPSNSADAVLLLGPLYHLVERSDRLVALREARRILKPQGVLIAAAISRFASLIDGLAKGFALKSWQPKFARLALLISKYLLLRVQCGAQRISERLGKTRCNGSS